MVYGTGGVGKTTLACSLPGKTAFIDADESLSVLKSQIKTVPQIVPVTDWPTLIAALNQSGWDGINNIVLDSITKIEEWVVANTLARVLTDANKKAQGVEDYGYGKGFQYVFDTFLPLLAALDRHVREGRNVVLVAHECIVNVANPSGPDWSRYEPRLQSPNSGKASIRYRVKEWADHVLFIGYDVNVEKERGAKTGKAVGSGTRTLYTSELPQFMAKSRTTCDSFDLTRDAEIWPLIIK